ncbi:MAG: alpha-amylase family glycosyl hydrolase [Acidimicrobiales bacterium]
MLAGRLAPPVWGRHALSPRPWWQGAVIYQIYPRSFCLADPAGRRARLGLPEGSAPDRLRDGAGDLEGVRRHLDHVCELGADAIWLSPINPSPMADFGYDVADYRGVDPLFGDLDTFDELVADAHRRGIRVLVDWVPNHTSDKHPWFKEARSSRQSAYRDFYVWRDPDRDAPERPPNNWKRAFGDGPAWSYDEHTGQWYLHLFLPQQPDLNWANPRVVEEMEAVLDFWLQRGVDGFRIDVVHGLGKPAGLPDVPPGDAETPYSALNDDESTHAILRRLRTRVDRFEQGPVLVGEVFLLSTEKVARYYGDGDELHLAFNFPPMFTPFSAASFRRRLAEIETSLVPRGAWPTWVLSNHDRPRHRTRYGGFERRARATAVMSIGMRGTLFLYAGEELGLEDAEVPGSLAVDPGGRDGCRAPIPWTPDAGHGWELDGSEAWLPFPPHARDIDVSTQNKDPSSVLGLYRRLLEFRRASSALRHGDLEVLELAASEVLAFVRRAPEMGSEESDVVVIVNFSAVDQEIGPGELGGSGPWRVEVSSGGDDARAAEHEDFGGRLGPEEAALLSWRHERAPVPKDRTGT